MNVIVETIRQVIVDFWSVLGDMSPYLLFGFALAGLLSVVISARTIERHLGGAGFWPVFKAALFGVPLPLCSCGVIPVGASLHRQGASRGATAAFMISTPQTGADSIMVTLSLLGPVFAIFRPVAALISGLLGGTLVAYGAGSTPDPGQDSASQAGGGSCEDGSCCGSADDGNQRPRGFWATVRKATTYGFLTMPEDIGRSMLVGLAIAAVITAVAGPGTFAGVLHGGILSMLLMMVLGIPIYVCATASVPVAAALITSGASPGVALVFLMTGPATNAATIATIWRTMGHKTAVLYLVSVAGTALASGLALDYVFHVSGMIAGKELSLMLQPGTIKTLLAIILLAVLTLGAVRSYLPARKHISSPKDIIVMENCRRTELKVGGMNCNHCRMAVERALSEMPGNETVEVDLRAGRAVVAGNAEPDEMVKVVQALGYTAEVANSDGEPPAA